MKIYTKQYISGWNMYKSTILYSTHFIASHVHLFWCFSSYLFGWFVPWSRLAWHQSRTEVWSPPSPPADFGSIWNLKSRGQCARDLVISVMSDVSWNLLNKWWSDTRWQELARFLKILSEWHTGLQVLACDVIHLTGQVLSENCHLIVLHSFMTSPITACCHMLSCFSCFSSFLKWS